MLINEWRLEGEGMLANDGLLYPYKIPAISKDIRLKYPRHTVNILKFHT